MSIIFDESEFQSFSYSPNRFSADEGLTNRPIEAEIELADDEKLLLVQYRQLPADRQRKVLTHIRHLLESAHSKKKINLLKAIEESKSTPVNENLSDIIKEIIK